jgi:predicted kinase
MGRIGTGKSTLAKHLSKVLKIDHFSSDRIRKNLAGLPLYERPNTTEREKLYSTEMSEKTYQHLFEKTITYIESGRSVVIDATFSSRSTRSELLEVLNSMNSNYMFIETQASDETIISRLKARDIEKDIVSDARLEDFEKLSSRYESPDELPDKYFLQVSTQTDLPETLEILYRKLAGRYFG